MYSKLKGAHQTRHSFQKVIKERKEKKRKEKKRKEKKRKEKKRKGRESERHPSIHSPSSFCSPHRKCDSIFITSLQKTGKTSILDCTSR
jgi:hypothetical protein